MPGPRRSPDFDLSQYTDNRTCSAVAMKAWSFFEFACRAMDTVPAAYLILDEDVAFVGLRRLAEVEGIG
jgi:hypothetical protein